MCGTENDVKFVLALGLFLSLNPPQPHVNIDQVELDGDQNFLVKLEPVR